MKKEDILAMSVELAKAHLTNSPMAPSDVAGFVRSIHQTLLDLQTASDPEVSSLTNSIEEARIASDAKGHVIHNEDVSGEEFVGLDHWLAKRIPARVAKKLNRDGDLHPSVFDDYLVCLEDGQEVKLLRPYIQRRFGLTFLEYMDKWNLPDDYPAAAPSYIRTKRAIAEKAGLGSSLRGKRGKARALKGTPA